MGLMNENWYTVEELSRKLKLHRESIRRLIRSGELHAVRFGKMLRVPESSFIEYVKQNVEKNYKSNSDKMTKDG